MTFLLRPTVAAALLYAVLAAPNHPAALTWGLLAVPPLELPVILLALWLARGRFAVALRIAIVAVIWAVSLLKAADFAMFSALARGFNPVGDLPLVISAWQLSTGAVGLLRASLGAVALVAAALGLLAALWWATGAWARLPAPRRTGAVAAFGALAVSAGVAAVEIGTAMRVWSLPLPVPGAAFTTRVGIERVETIRDTLADLRRFREAATGDPWAAAPDRLALLDRDLLVIFVESYGRTSHDTPRFAPTHRATLAEAEAALRESGLAMRSGFAAAPTRGGQSWLSHATFALGLWTTDQGRYLAALASGRQGLFHVAQAAGLHTAAIMPAIVLDWPEALRMGFDTVLAADDLGYDGPPFNWVTMPDQFTLAAFDRLVRDTPRDGPLVAQIALISSHAPWVPVPEMVAWDAVGDGEVFAPMAARGDPPEVVWRDRDRVRAQYRDAIDYSLRVALDYVARQAGPDAPLVVLLGDHQAAGFVALDDRPDVPVHVIGPPHLVARFDWWGWHDGLLPPSEVDVIRLDQMRDRLLGALSPGDDPSGATRP